MKTRETLRSAMAEVDSYFDTLLITGCSTSACVRATAKDAKSL